VRFIGEAHRGPGLWLGVELGDGSGKNDGSIDGKRYFTCLPKHGLFVRPDKATWQGFNVATLL
jgi:dynactin complex subunit